MIIPDKNLFIVTSALKPLTSPYSDEQRFQQTIDGLKSIRRVVPDAIIVTADVSVRPLSDLEKIAIAEKSNYFMDMSQDPNVMQLSSARHQSMAENFLLLSALQTLKHNPQISHVLSSVKRIFKISGRSVLQDTFDMSEYEGLFGKFVFKERIPTWMNQPEISHLLITRMYSFCPSLIDTYLQTLVDNIPVIQRGFDFEHAHFQNIPKRYLVEFEKIHCFGWLSGNGKIEHY